MPDDLISKKTRYEFREYFVGSYTLRTIEMAFDAADIIRKEDLPPGVDGARRSLVEQYYAGLDLKNPRDVKKLLHVFETAILEMRLEWRENYLKWLKRDGYVFQDERLVPIHGAPSVGLLEEVLRGFDDGYLLQQVSRMQHAIDSDPWLAIGTAKELVESCCKTILKERGVAYAENSDMGELTKATLKTLRLSAADISEDSKDARVIKTLLNNLGTITKNLSELRNTYGTGHGQAMNAKGLQPRHAKLACGAAATFAIFLYETHKDRS